jgi:hypothetical protein
LPAQDKKFLLNSVLYWKRRNQFFQESWFTLFWSGLIDNFPANVAIRVDSDFQVFLFHVAPDKTNQSD